MKPKESKHARVVIRQGKVAQVNHVPVMFIKEGKMYITYSPVLDLSTCGETLDEAMQNFREALGLFFEECAKRHTLEQVLESYGWQRVRTRPPSWEPPLIIGSDNVSVPVTA